jgi:peptidyl-prolyl cis-trans isomerase SurA
MPAPAVFAGGFRNFITFMRIVIFLAFSLLTGSLASFAQEPKVLDRVVGVVGKNPILLSELHNALIERDQQGMRTDKCETLEMLVYQKLLVAQADRDSVTVTDTEVDTELSRRMAYFIQQFGSEEKLEQFYGKRTNVLKDELRADVQEQLIADKMEGRITGDAKLTPAEVREYFNSLHEDSLPLIGSEVELQQLVKKPSFSAEARKEARDLLNSYRQRVVDKQASMSTLARLYSEDQMSAKEGGVINNMGKGMLDPAFESVVFKLKKGEISEVFESSFGYHFIELMQRKGDLVDFRHILIIPKINNSDFFRAKKLLDSIHAEIGAGRLTFESAVEKFSDDAETKQNGGLMINPQTASTRWDHEMLAKIDPKLVALVTALPVGDISTPMEFMGNDGKPGYRILKLKNRIDPHRANLKEDYQRIMLLAAAARKRTGVKDWIRIRSKQTYIRLEPGFSCDMGSEWTFTN